MTDKEVITKANNILFENELWVNLVKAYINWDILKQRKTGVCSECGVKARTVLHHKDISLKPKKLVSLYNNRNIPFARKNSIKGGAEKVVEDFIKIKGGWDNVVQSTIYYGVGWEDVIELCSKCHKKEH